MKRSEVNKKISDKITELARRSGISRIEMTRQLLVIGIRSFPNQENFLKPYPEKPEPIN